MLYVEELKWNIHKYFLKSNAELFYHWVVLSDLDGSLFITALTKEKGNKQNQKKRETCPAGRIKCLWLSPVSAEFVFIPAACCVKQRAKGGETIYFSEEENIPFSRKNQHFTATGKKKPTLLPSQIKRNRAERELRLPLWHLAATRPWLTSTVTLRLCSCREKGPHKTAVEERSGREIVGFLSVWILLGQDFSVRLKMCNRCSQMLGIV